jgi:hypothetical protein
LPRRETTTLEADRPTVAPSAGRAARHKQGVMRRTGIVLPAAAIAGVVVGVVAVVANLLSPNGNGAASLSQAISDLPKSKSIGLLEQERQQIIVMNAAASTMATSSKATTVSPNQMASAQAAASPSSDTSGNTGNTGSGTTGNTGSSSSNTTPVAAPDPGSAQSIAYNMMSSFGFSPGSQWECLDETWQKESSWEYDAENASGAYGIPQALPASKMASAGSDYETNPTTQIKWGLGYISSVYGTPCSAWSHSQATNWY